MNSLDLGPKLQKAFEQLKHAQIRVPVLAMPDEGLPYHVEIDASDYVTGVLFSNGTEKKQVHKFSL